MDALPYAGWEPTKTTLHLWCQIVGKIALRSTALRNHWWNCTLRPTARGVSTLPLQAGGVTFDIELDFVDHLAIVRSGAAHEPATFPLRDGLSVAAFYDELRGALSAFDVRVPIVAKPYGIPGQTTPFREDRAHASYDAPAVRRWWNVIRWTTGVFEDFATGFAGKQGPVQLFWHSLDLALGRYSGRRAPGPPPDDPVAREAYTHEVIAFGFWAGDPDVPEASYYTYTAPEPATLTQRALQPGGAAWHAAGSGHLGRLPYETVRTDGDPRAALLTFLRSGYEAGAHAAAWDLAAFEHDGPRVSR